MPRISKLGTAKTRKRSAPQTAASLPEMPSVGQSNYDESEYDDDDMQFCADSEVILFYLSFLILLCLACFHLIAILNCSVGSVIVDKLRTHAYMCNETVQVRLGKASEIEGRVITACHFWT